MIWNRIGAGSHDFDDSEYIFCLLSSKDGFDCDINVFKYWCDKNFNGDYDYSIHYKADGMLVFDFFSSCRCTQYALCWIWICFVFFLI